MLRKIEKFKCIAMFVSVIFFVISRTHLQPQRLIMMLSAIK